MPCDVVADPGVGRVVVAMVDPNPLVDSQVLSPLPSPLPRSLS